MKMVAASKMRVAQVSTEKARGLIVPLIKSLGDLPGTSLTFPCLILAPGRFVHHLTAMAACKVPAAQKWLCLTMMNVRRS